MEKRKDKRYSISDYLDGMVSQETFFLEIDLIDSIRAKIIDLSMGGLGFEIEEIKSSYLEELQSPGELFIKIYIPEEVLFVEAKKVWSAIIEDKRGKIIKGGLAFSVISAKDKMKLSKSIEESRKRI